MKTIHLEEIDSTQNYLKKSFNDLINQGHRDILVSCDKQSKGQGRNAKSWDHLEEALAFSFTLSPNDPLTLSSLEVAVLIAFYFRENQSCEVLLKWPNDLMTTEGKKCGGIISAVIDNTLIVGAGVNFVNPKDKNYQTPGGAIKPKNLSSDFKEKMPTEIYQYLLNNRLKAQDVSKRWNELSCHLNKEVTLIEADKSISGIFQGLGPHGEALIESNGKVRSFFNGSLLL
jgi:BirA family biotin operon repressor/biotin-[acetyl-CoA-carboxylase] ligase